MTDSFDKRLDRALRLVKNAGARLIFINQTETPWDYMASIIFRENAGEVLGRLAERI